MPTLIDPAAISAQAASESAHAAIAAAIVALVVVLVQLYVGHRQSAAALLAAKAAMTSAESSGRHVIAGFRQKWIDALRDTLAEHHSIVMTVTEYPYPEEVDRKLSALGTKIELMLNPTESPSDDLLSIIEKIYDCPNVDERVAMDSELVRRARAILKAEWEKVKTELKASST